MTDVPVPEPRHLVVGHVGRAHGTKGDVFVHVLTDRPESFFAPDAELILGDEEGEVDGEELEVVEVDEARPFKDGYLVRFAGVEGRDGAESFTRRYLLVPAEWAAPNEEDELYYHELLGMSVETVEGEPVGTVREVFETKPAHLLEVKAENGKSRLIPFTKQVVREIDAGGRRLVIDPPPGLLEI